jgi:hypothetical protein
MVWNFAAFCAAFLFAQTAAASLDPTIGAQMAVASAQDLLVSPPLPRLEAGGRWAVTPQIGYMYAQSSSELAAAEGQPATASYTGKLTGFSGGLGFTSPTMGRAGFFGFVAYSSISGKIDIYDSTGLTATLDHMKSNVIAGVAGVNLRIIGDSKSPFAMGAFAGPAFMRVTSKFNVGPAGQPHDTYTMNPNISGGYFGVQAKVMLGKLGIGPYFLYMKEFTDNCKAIQLESQFGGSIAGCAEDPNKEGYMDLAASFSGVGLFLSYNKFRFNVFSKAARDSAYSDIAISNYTVSYSFGID